MADDRCLVSYREAALVVVVLISGAVADFLSGLLGLGGGILLTPVLLYAPQVVGHSPEKPNNG